MEKVERFLHRAFSLVDSLIVLSGGVLGGYVTWFILRAFDMSILAKMGTTAVVALVCMIVTALVWKLMKIFN